MREELLLGTAVAPSHMYLFPLGTKYVIGTTGKVCSIKNSNIPTFVNRRLGKGYYCLSLTFASGYEESGLASQTRREKCFLKEKLIAQTPNCRVNIYVASFPIRILWLRA